MVKPRFVDEADPRVCKVCGVSKALVEFSVNHHRVQADTHDLTCKACRAVAQRLRRRSDSIVEQITIIMNERARKNRMEWLFEYLHEHPCVDCGESDPVILEFDHIDRSQKVRDIGRLVPGGAWESVLAEIAKCEVRCCNCHRRRTAAQFGWYSYRGQDHDAVASRLIEALRADAAGQQRFELAEPVPTGPPPVLVGLAEHLVDSGVWKVGQRVVVMARCRVDPLDQGLALVVEDAVVVDRAEVDFLNLEEAAPDAS